MNNKIEMKMKKNQLTMLVLFVTMLGFTACSDDDKVSISTVSITTTVDTTIEGLQLTGGTYTFETINTSAKTAVSVSSYKSWTTSRSNFLAASLKVLLLV